MLWAGELALFPRLSAVRLLNRVLEAQVAYSPLKGRLKSRLGLACRRSRSNLLLLERGRRGPSWL